MPTLEGARRRTAARHPQRRHRVASSAGRSSPAAVSGTARSDQCIFAALMLACAFSASSCHRRASSRDACSSALAACRSTSSACNSSSSPAWNPVSGQIRRASHSSTARSPPRSSPSSWPSRWPSASPSSSLNSAPSVLRAPISFLTELLAAIPSVVYGLWAVFVARAHRPRPPRPCAPSPPSAGPASSKAPTSASACSPPVHHPRHHDPAHHLVHHARHHAAPCRPTSARPSLALGATRWEMIRIGVLRNARIGIVGAVILGLGRALGETMAVTMVIGNHPADPANPFSPPATRSPASSPTSSPRPPATSTSPPSSRSASRSSSSPSSSTPSPACWSGPLPAAQPQTRSILIVQPATPASYEPQHLAFRLAQVSNPTAARPRFPPPSTHQCVRHRPRGRRQPCSCFVPLVAILVYLSTRAPARSTWAFFTHMPAPCRRARRRHGELHRRLRHHPRPCLASVIGIPIGIAAGVYLAEYRPRQDARPTSSASPPTSSTVSPPSSWASPATLWSSFARTTSPPSAGGVALAIMMVPTVTRTTEEMLSPCPHSIREAALGLGVPRWRTDPLHQSSAPPRPVSSPAACSPSRASPERPRRSSSPPSATSSGPHQTQRAHRRASAADLRLRHLPVRRVASPRLGRRTRPHRP